MGMQCHVVSQGSTYTDDVSNRGRDCLIFSKNETTILVAQNVLFDFRQCLVNIACSEDIYGVLPFLLPKINKLDPDYLACIGKFHQMLERPHDIANILSHQSSSALSMAAGIVNKIYILSFK